MFRKAFKKNFKPDAEDWFGIAAVLLIGLALVGFAAML